LTLNGELFSIEVDSVYKNRSEYSSELSIDNAGNAIYKSTSKYLGTAFGIENQEFSEMRPEDFKRYYQKVLTELSQSAVAITPLTPNFTKYPGSLSFEASIKKYAVVSDKYIYFRNPSGFSVFNASNEPRELPFYYSSYFDFKSSTRVYLPDSTQRVLMMPRALNWAGVFNLGSITYEVNMLIDKTGRKYIDFSQKVSLKPTIIPSDDYETIQTISSTMSDIEDDVIVIELKNGNL
jgi:hypothetical protein